MGNFYTSAEVRWFLHEQQVQWDQILAWFRRHDHQITSGKNCLIFGLPDVNY